MYWTNKAVASPWQRIVAAIIIVAQVRENGDEDFVSLEYKSCFKHFVYILGEEDGDLCDNWMFKPV